MTEETKTPPVTIKKYANRRLYNTATSSYVTLDHLAEMVKEGVDFAVYDAKSGEDITRSVLTHIIVEQEGKGQNLLPISFLRHLISFYGDSLQAVVPKYLEHSMHSFAQNQESMRDYLQETFGNLSPFTTFEEMSRQNMAFFESAMKMFSPVGQAPANSDKADGKPAEGDMPSSDDIDALRSQLAEMQRRLDKLGAK
ncbi:MAG: polyhydroxyalkanoate synthesis repressor PhaR [Rhodospirillales bacterium]